MNLSLISLQSHSHRTALQQVVNCLSFSSHHTTLIMSSSIRPGLGDSLHANILQYSAGQESSSGIMWYPDWCLSILICTISFLAHRLTTHSDAIVFSDGSRVLSFSLASLAWVSQDRHIRASVSHRLISDRVTDALWVTDLEPEIPSSPKRTC